MILQKVNEDKIKFMKSKSKDELEATRAIIAEVKVRQILKKRELTDEEVVEVLSTLTKQYNETLIYEKRRDDAGNVLSIMTKLEVIKSYMPEQMSEEEVLEFVQNVIAETGFSTAKDKGKLLGKVMPSLKGKADNRLVNSMVTSLLG